MGSDMFLSGFAEKNRVREAESDRARAVEGERKALEERDAALKRVAELEAEVKHLQEGNDALIDANQELHEAIGNMITGRPQHIEPINADPFLQEIERLREDNARLIRAVCALAEGEVKRSEVSDE